MVSVGKTYSTKEVAVEVSVHWMTLHKWIAANKVHPSQRLGPKGDWRWTEEDVEKVRKYRGNYFRAGQGRRSDIQKKKVKKLKKK